MDGLERRFEVLLEGLLTSFCLLQVLKPLLSAFLLLGLDPIQFAGPPAHRAAAGHKGMSEADDWETEEKVAEKTTALKAAKGESWGGLSEFWASL